MKKTSQNSSVIIQALSPTVMESNKQSKTIIIPEEKDVEQIELLEEKVSCNVVPREPKGCIKWLEFTQRMKPQTNAIGPGFDFKFLPNFKF
jgi:hypothetical protein